MPLYDLIELKRACLASGCDLLIDEVNFNISLLGPRPARVEIIQWLKERLQPDRTVTQLKLFSQGEYG